MTAPALVHDDSCLLGGREAEIDRLGAQGGLVRFLPCYGWHPGWLEQEGGLKITRKAHESWEEVDIVLALYRLGRPGPSPGRRWSCAANLKM